MLIFLIYTSVQFLIWMAISFIALNTFFKTSGFISTEILPAYVVTFANHHSGGLGFIYYVSPPGASTSSFHSLNLRNEPEWDAASRHVFSHQGLAHSFHSTPGSFFSSFQSFEKFECFPFFVTWFYHFRREEFPQALFPQLLNFKILVLKD